MNANTKQAFTDSIQAESVDTIERDLIKIWENVFEQPISLDNDFFELGGDSIKAMALISKINRKFGVLLQIEEIFEDGNLKYQLNKIKGEQGTATSSNVATTTIPKAPPLQFYPLSNTQKGFFALSFLDPETVQCNIPIVYRIYGGMNLDLCKNSLLEIIRRHDILRTAFRIKGSKVVQEVLDHVPFDIVTIERNGQTMPEMIKACVKPFDLTKPPLLRLNAVVDKGKVTYLIFEAHHIISDLISFNVILNEFFYLYRGEPLKPLKIQYKDFAYWQQERMPEVIATQKDFWVNTYKTVPPKIKFPANPDKTKKHQYKAATYKFEFTKDEINKVREVSKKEKISQFTFMMSLYYVMLYKVSNQNDLVVSLTSHGRNYPEFHDLIGVFVNTLPVRMKIDPDMTFLDFVKQFKNEMPKYFANQDFPYDAVLQHLRANQLIQNESIYNVMFEHHMIDWEYPKFNLVDRPLLEPKCDLAFQVANKRVGEQGEENLIFVEYNKTVFDAETIEIIARFFSRLVEEVTEHLDIKISDLSNYEPFKNGPYKSQAKFHLIDKRHVL